MKNNLLRAVLAASFSLFVAGALTSMPGYGADAPKAPSVSKSVQKQLVDAQKALNAKDWTTALAKLKEAQAVADLKDYDKYLINFYLGVVYVNTNDRPDAANAFLAATESTTAPAEQQAQALRLAIELQNEQKNYAKVIELAQVAVKNNGVDGTIATAVAIAYYGTNDFANATLWAQKAIDLGKAAGKAPEHGAYEILLMSQNKAKNIPAVIQTLEVMSNLYGEADDWGRLIDLTLGTLSTPNKNTREIAAFYIYRLRLLTNATTSGDDYLLMAELSIGLNSPGDAIQALQAGTTSGSVSSVKAAPLLAKANARIKGGDEAALPGAEAAAAKSPKADGDISVAEGYYGYGRFADAVRVAQRAIGKGGPRQTQATLLLGISQARLGDPAAAATLAQVSGDPALVRAAQLWTLYVTRKYGTAAATPAASH